MDALYRPAADIAHRGRFAAWRHTRRSGARGCPQSYFTFNLNPNNATVVDSKEGKVVGAFDLGGRPELVGTDAKGNVFANLVPKDVVLQIDSRTMTAGQAWPVAPCQGPRTMAVDQRNGRLFV